MVVDTERGARGQKIAHVNTLSDINEERLIVKVKLNGQYVFLRFSQMI